MCVCVHERRRETDRAGERRLTSKCVFAYLHLHSCVCLYPPMSACAHTRSTLKFKTRVFVCVLKVLVSVCVSGEWVRDGEGMRSEEEIEGSRE